MRYSRLVFGVLIICAAIWVIVREQITGASADAVVNAQIVTVTTPIAGLVKQFDRALGDAVSRGDILGIVTDDRVDSARLDDLILQRDLLRIRRELLRGQTTILQNSSADLSNRTDVYAIHTREDLQVRIAEAEERLRILTQPDSGADAIALSLAREEFGRIQAMVAAAEKGVYIAGGYNDAPFSEQSATGQFSELASLAAEIDSATEELAALTRRIDLERVRAGRVATTAISSPVRGIVWEKLVVSGVNVQRGDTLVRLADCDNTFITLSVAQSIFNRLKVGTEATFRFDGSGETMVGTVARLAGTSAASFYGSLAVAPSQRHLERADVLLQIPELTRNPELGCAIGRTGRAFFEARPLDWLRTSFW